MTKAEVLAPVGNRAMLEAAVRSGADAVYLGMNDFNARRGAENFDRDGLREAVAFCHVRGVRVYLTLNTLLSDEELPRALSSAAFAYECGVDAVIVQDLGLARILHESFPDFPLHASTQMTVHTPAALSLLKRLGFVQVVVSREMSRADLVVFCARAKELGIRVEVFVHGALCMCMSGQCYLSAVLGGRSGNRGLCAGPCRLPFSSTAQEAYDLSLKDLSLTEYLHDLASLGVSSFKIEGRLKRPEYVAAATAVCRKLLDGEPCDEWKQALLQVFSRSGFTDGYYTAHRGKNMFGTRGKEDVLLSAQVLNKIHELYRVERQNVKLSASIELRADSPVKLTVADGENCVVVCGDAPSVAETKALSREDVLAKILKTGNTPFFFETIDVSLDSDLFYPASKLNALRRNALEELERVRAACKRNPSPVPDVTPSAKQKKAASALVAAFSSPEQVPQDLEGVSAIVLPIESAFETYSSKPELLLSLPRGIASEKALQERLALAAEHGVRSILCGNLSAVELTLEAGLSPIFDFSMNLFSTQAYRTAEMLGAAGAICSFEMRDKQIRRLNAQIPVGVIAYGHLPLMLMRNCPIRNQKTCDECRGSSALTDRRGVRFPVRCRGGYSELYNSVPLWILDRLDDFDCDFFLLNFTLETRAECAKVLAAYREKKAAACEFTRGLYYRGVE